MSAFSKENPFVTNGEAMKGKLRAAIKFEREKELKRREALPEEERKRLEAADRNMVRKMNS